MIVGGATKEDGEPNLSPDQPTTINAFVAQFKRSIGCLSFRLSTQFNRSILGSLYSENSFTSSSFIPRPPLCSAKLHPAATTIKAGDSSAHSGSPSRGDSFITTFASRMRPLGVFAYRFDWPMDNKNSNHQLKFTFAPPHGLRKWPAGH